MPGVCVLFNACLDVPNMEDFGEWSPDQSNLWTPWRCVLPASSDSGRCSAFQQRLAESSQ